MSTDHPVVRSLRTGVVALAALFLLAFLYVAARRMGYPYELEWLEGGSLDSIRRIGAGHSLYAQPTLDFIAYPYTPLYYEVAALITRVTGDTGFLVMRALSTASTLAALWFIALIVRRETARWDTGWLAAGLMLATYNVTQSWFDIARVDSLFLALFLGGLHALQVVSARRLVVGGLCLAAAFLTKQTALLAAAPLLAWCVYRDRWKAAYALVPFVTVLAMSTLYYEWRSGGWYWYYVVELQRHAGFFMKRRLVYFWTRDLLSPFLVVFPIAVLCALDSLRRGRRDALTVTIGAGAMVGAAFLSRLRTGNAVNTLMPAYAGLAILAGCAVGRVALFAQSLREPRRHLLTGTVWGLCLAQFAMLAYNPARWIPTPADRAAGDRVVQSLSVMDGDIFVPCSSYLAEMAGKTAHAHLQEIIDITLVDDEWAARVRQSARDALQSQRFSAIIPCRLHPEFLEAAGLARTYVATGSLFEPADRAFLTPVAVPLRPEVIYRPRPVAGASAP